MVAAAATPMDDDDVDGDAILAIPGGRWVEGGAVAYLDKFLGVFCSRTVGRNYKFLRSCQKA